MVNTHELRDDIGLPRTRDDESPEERKDRIEKEKEYRKRLMGELNIPSKFDSLMPLINEWQWSRTKSLKRSLLGLCLVLVAGGVAGIDLSSANPFGFPMEGASSTRLAIFLFCILIVNLLMFEASYLIDKNRRALSIQQIEKRLPDARRAYAEVRRLTRKHNVSVGQFFEAIGESSGNQLLERFHAVRQFMGDPRIEKTPENRREAIKTKLSNLINSFRFSHTTDSFLYIAEQAVIIVLFLAATTALTPVWGISYS